MRTAGKTIDAFRVGPPQYELRHNEVVALYKWQILKLELELDEIKHDRDQMKNLFLEQLGLTQDRSAVSSTEQESLRKPMSPLRMRQSLESASRKAVNEKK